MGLGFNEENSAKAEPWESVMGKKLLERLPDFLQALAYPEPPLGIFYSDQPPADGLSPTPLPGHLPTREKELAGQIDWPTIYSNFSCAIGVIWRARKKGKAAYFSAERFGCPGGAFYLGYLGPQTEAIAHYISTGIPGRMEGECYFPTPQASRDFFVYLDPRPAPAGYCILKPLDQFSGDETPELVSFFCRPEIMCGLHQLTSFVTGDLEVVRSPMGAACSNLITWPLHYLARGENKAVLGGWDPAARKFFKTDELSLTVPWPMFLAMLERWQDSFLSTKAWRTVRKKIARSARTWGESRAGAPSHLGQDARP